MIPEEDFSIQIARDLLKIQAIKLQPNHPFTWASGWKSPIYCDNRLSLSYPGIRKYITRALVKTIEKNFGIPDMIAGVATAAIPQGALVADAMQLPLVYVRSSAKDHGRQNLIEGHVTPGSVVVIEDLVSTGMSSLKAVKALREAGCTVKGMVSVFTYGFSEAEKNFRNESCTLVSLCDYTALLREAVDAGYLKRDELQALESWRQSPQTWGTVPSDH